MTELLAIVPAYNEEHSLPLVVSALRSFAAEAPMAFDILVVDDGSTDRTADVARALGTRLLSLPCNLGVGGGLQAGFRYAGRAGYRCVFQLDGDGQHDVQSVPAVLDPVLSGRSDLCIGSRFAAGGSAFEISRARRLALWMVSRWTSMLIGQRITDTSSGFRAFGQRAIRLFAENYPHYYLGDTVEALVLAHRRGLQISEVAVDMLAREHGTSSATTLVAARRAARTVISTTIGRHP